MPRFPTYERQVGISGGSTASFASEGAFTAPARALANLGGAVADLGATVAAGEQRIRDTQSDAWLSKARAETALEMQSIERDLQQSATEGAKDFTPAARARYEELRKAKLAQAPSPRAAQAYQSWSDGFGVDVVGRAARFQAESELAKRTSDFADAMNAHAQVIYADPSQYEAVRKRAMDDFEGAKQWMTPEQETAAREKVDHDLKLARAKSLVEFSPADFMAEVGKTTTVTPSRVAPDVQTRGQQAMGFFQSKGYTKEQAAGIVGNLIAESNLRPSGAVGDNGTAFGIAQWRGERLTRLKRFANANGKDWQDFGTQLAFVDMELQNHETGAYQALKNAKTVDEATAAFVGYERPAGWTPNNPRGGHNYKGRLSHAAAMAGGEAIAFHEGGDFSTNPNYAGLSVDEIRTLFNQAETTVNAQQVTAYTQMKDAMDLGIADGTILSEDQILGSNLNDGDKAMFLRRFQETRKDEIAAMETIAALNGRSLSVDPFDSDARKNIDNAAGLIKKQATPEQYQLAAEEITRQSGIVPKDVVNAIRKGLESKNPAEVAAAAQQANRLSQIDPAALGRRDGGKEAHNAADDFQHMVNNLNLSPEEAGKRIIEMNDPEKRRERKAMEPAAKEFIKEMQDFSLAGQFDTWFGAEPDVGFSPGQELGIQAEFLAIAEDAFYQSNGDPDVAQNRAIEQMKRLYGVTELTGRKVLMKHPPEKYWPAFKIADAAQSLSYPAQLDADIREFSPDVDMSSVQLVTTPETDAMIKRGEMPGYAVLYKDENGVLQTIPGKLWKPDISNLKEMQGKVDAVEQQRKVDAAKADQVQKKQAAPYRDLKPEDFLSGNDPVFGPR